MAKRQTIRHEFVEFVPEALEEGVLYVSIPYATTTHKCACGCGNKVVLPLHPTHWKLTFDGATVSLSPSVGNWGFSCQSHYWIERDRIRWAPKWSKEKVEAGRERDRRGRERWQLEQSNQGVEVVVKEPAPPKGFLRRLLGKFRN